MCFLKIPQTQRELVAWLCLTFWCLVIVVGLFLTMPRVRLQFVIVVCLDHNHYYLTGKLEIHHSMHKPIVNLVVCSLCQSVATCTHIPKVQVF